MEHGWPSVVAACKVADYLDAQHETHFVEDAGHSNSTKLNEELNVLAKTLFNKVEPASMVVSALSLTPKSYSDEERIKIISSALLESPELVDRSDKEEMVAYFIELIKPFITVIYLPHDPEGRYIEEIDIPVKEGCDGSVFVPPRNTRTEFIPESERIINEAKAQGYIKEDDKLFASQSSACR